MLIFKLLVPIIGTIFQHTFSLSIHTQIFLYYQFYERHNQYLLLSFSYERINLVKALLLTNIYVQDNIQSYIYLRTLIEIWH